MIYVVIIVLILLLILAGIAVALLNKENLSSNNIDLPYKTKRYIFSPAEYSFYKTLMKYCPNEYYIAPKIRLADFIQVDRKKCGNKFQTWFNKINCKHADFLICDKEKFTVTGVIELDDSSHKSKKTQERDTFINKLYEQCDIPIFHQPCKKGYTTEEIKKIFTTLNQSEEITPKKAG